MATFSTLLGLKLNAPTDPFQLSDFIQNWNILDANPGVFICTSGSRPSYTSGQAGRLIFMTDLKQLSYWNGSSWNDLRDSAPVFAGGSFINSNISMGASPTVSVCTFTTPRPCAISVILSATYSIPAQVGISFFQSITFDGQQQQLGSYRERWQIADLPALLPTQFNIASLAVIPSVAAGSHTIGVLVQNSNSFSTSLNLIGAKTIGMISLYNTNNTL